MTVDLKNFIASFPDFPEDGILFRDISPLIGNGEAYRQAIDQIAEFAKPLKPDLIAGPESRGFIVGSPLAYSMNIGFVTARKENKLPGQSIAESYQLEYGGANTLEMETDSIKAGQRVLIVDDLLATGGTISATKKLIERLGGIVVGVAFIVELEALNGREKIMESSPIPFLALIEY